MMLKRRTNRWARLKLLLFVPVAAGALYAFAQPEVKKTVEQAMQPVSVQQDSIQRIDLEQLEAFFKRKAEDAFGGKKDYTIRKVSGSFNSFFVNKNNKMMLNERYFEGVETLSVLYSDLLRKEYQDAANKKRTHLTKLLIKYDRGSSSDTIAFYLQAIKKAYLQVRGEISEQLGGVSEARLDSIYPILVDIAEPNNFSSQSKTASDILLPIEVSLFAEGRGTSTVVMKHPSLQELELKLKEYKATAGDELKLAVGLKWDKDVTMGVVEDVKEVIRKTLYGK